LLSRNLAEDLSINFTNIDIDKNQFRYLAIFNYAK
jgi:hypothetical protein